MLLAVILAVISNWDAEAVIDASLLICDAVGVNKVLLYLIVVATTWLAVTFPVVVKLLLDRLISPKLCVMLPELKSNEFTPSVTLKTSFISLCYSP